MKSLKFRAILNTDNIISYEYKQRRYWNISAFPLQSKTSVVYRVNNSLSVVITVLLSITAMQEHQMTRRSMMEIYGELNIILTNDYFIYWEVKLKRFENKESK